MDIMGLIQMLMSPGVSSAVGGLANAGSNAFSSILSNLANAQNQAYSLQGAQGQRSELGQAGQDLIKQFQTNQGAADANSINQYDTAYTRLGHDLHASNQDFLGQVNAGTDKLQGVADTTSNILRNTLIGSGDQERKDINTQFNNYGANATSSLNSRGLGNTTIVPQIGANIERQRADAQGGLTERLLQQKLGVEGQIGNTNLGIQSNGLQSYLGALGNANASENNLLGQNLLSSADRTYGYGSNANQNSFNMGQGQIGLQQGLYGQIANILANTNISGPNQANYLNTQGNLGQGSVTPSAPQTNWAQSIFGPAAGGLAAGGTAAGLSALFGGGGTTALGGVKLAVFCVAPDSIVQTPQGDREISTLAVGDEAMAGDGTYRVVHHIVAGPNPPHQVGLFVRINDRLTLCAIHEIDGRAAATYQVGESIPTRTGREQVRSIERVDCPYSLDIKLAGADTYVANGIVVDSMLRKFPME